MDGEIPNQEYQDNAKQVLKTNMMLGARRLANLIMTIYGGQQTATFAQWAARGHT